MLYVDLDAAASEATVRSARGARVARCTCSMLASCIELLVLQICSSALWLVRSVSSGLLLVVEFLHGGRGSRHGPACGVGLELQVARLLKDRICVQHSLSQWGYNGVGLCERSEHKSCK